MTHGQMLAPREQRVLEALRGLAPPGERRVRVSINALAARLGMLPGEASRAVMKLWLLGRIRGVQEPRGAGESEFEIVDVGDGPPEVLATEPTEPPEPANTNIRSLSANTNTTSEPASATGDPRLPASAPEEGKEGGRGVVPEKSDDGTLNDDDDDVPTFNDDRNVDDVRFNVPTSDVNDVEYDERFNDVADDDDDGVVADVGCVDVGGGSRGEGDAPATTAATPPRGAVRRGAGLQPIAGMLPDVDALGTPRRGSDPIRDLAYECASALGDTENLRAYLKLAHEFPEARLRRALTDVLAIPEGHLMRPGAMFTYLVKHRS